MIHEVMVLDHSGPPLAVILHGASMKLLLFAVLLAQAVLPMGDARAARRPRARCSRGVLVVDRRRRAGRVAAGAAAPSAACRCC